jgi:hypothetical protein
LPEKSIVARMYRRFSTQNLPIPLSSLGCWAKPQGTDNRAAEGRYERQRHTTMSWAHRQSATAARLASSWHSRSRGLVFSAAVSAFGCLSKRHETLPVCPVDLVDVLVGQRDLPYGSGLALETAYSGRRDARLKCVSSRPKRPPDPDRQILITLWTVSSNGIRLLPVSSSPLWIDENRRGGIHAANASLYGAYRYR